MSDFDTVRDALDYLHGDGLCDCHDAHAALARIKAAYVEMEKATAYHYRVEDVLAENERLREALRPFAGMAHDDWPVRPHPQWWSQRVLDARAALEGAGSGQDPVRDLTAPDTSKTSGEEDRRSEA